MTYNAIRPAAYVLDPGAEPFTGFYRALAFPNTWRQPILDLYQHGWRNPAPHKQVPIARLNAAIRAVAPDLVSVAERATITDSKPWLYTDTEYPLSVVSSLIVSWLHTLRPAPEDFPLVRDTVQKLDLKSLHWDLMSVDLTEQTLSIGGTAMPALHLYRLLPEVLAARIEQLPPYEYYGTQVTFRRVATREGAELMSWPPSEYRPRAAKGQSARPWHFSAVIKITLQTVPFSPVPTIHLSTGIRRWVRGAFRPDGQAVGVYLLTDGPWLAESPQASRFALAYLDYSRKLRKVAWTGLGPEEILSHLSLSRDFPLPDVLGKEAETWIDGHDGVTAAVTHHTTMGYHGVKPGLSPSERQRLTQWAAKALLPELQPAGDMTESELKPTLPRRVLEKPPSMPGENAAPERRADVSERQAEVNVSNAARRRERLARAVGDEHVLTCHVLYQTEEARDELIHAAERSLGLREYSVGAPAPGTRVWRAPEVEVRIHALQLGSIGGPLGEATPPKRGKQHREAVDQRRTATRDFVRSLPEDSQVVFVELDGKEAFTGNRQTADPKLAIRLGCADAGRVSQFIALKRQPDDGEAGSDAAGGDEEESKLKHRADAAWADGLRQVGMSFVPQHTLDPAVPERLNQLAFWIVRRNNTETSKNKQFTPIAVLMRPDQDSIMGRTPDTPTWVPYPELLKGLTGLVRGPELKTAEQQAAETARFIRQVLYNLRGEPTVVLTHAQNIRSRWQWLENGRLIPDKIQAGNGPVQDLALHGKHLRLIRLRDGERNETAQWWAPVNEEIAGTSKGLWVPAGADDGNRLFYATTGKTSSHHGRRDDTKLTPRPGGKERPNESAWNPTLLEIAVAGCAPGDNPEVWAMYVQQQRFADDYRDALKLPLVLHLAELAREYALPYGDALAQAGQDAKADDPLTSGDEDDPE
jgi:hypothetical protein